MYQIEDKEIQKNDEESSQKIQRTNQKICLKPPKY